MIHKLLEVGALFMQMFEIMKSKFFYKARCDIPKEENKVNK